MNNHQTDLSHESFDEHPLMFCCYLACIYIMWKKCQAVFCFAPHQRVVSWKWKKKKKIDRLQLHYLYHCDILSAVYNVTSVDGGDWRKSAIGLVDPDMKFVFLFLSCTWNLYQCCLRKSCLFLICLQSEHFFEIFFFKITLKYPCFQSYFLVHEVTIQ